MDRTARKAFEAGAQRFFGYDIVYVEPCEKARAAKPAQKYAGYIHCLLTGEAMYYVLQVAPGTELKTEAHISDILSKELYGQCFHPTRHLRKKFHGHWKDIHEKLLPGYVFITTDNIEKLYQELQKVPMFTKLLGKNNDYFISLNNRDIEWLEKLTGQEAGKGQQHEVSLSQISIDEGSEIRIVSGPLKNIDGMIKKINLHKRIAEVEVDFMNRTTVIYLGIELLEKK